MRRRMGGWQRGVRDRKVERSDSTPPPGLPAVWPRLMVRDGHAPPVGEKSRPTTPPPRPADIPRKLSAAEERDLAIARLADALTDYVQVLTDDAAGDKPPAWTAFRHVREGERLPSWDPADDVIAVKGPDVGMIGPRAGLAGRNEVRRLEGGVMSKDDFPDLYAAIGDRYCTGMEDGDLFRLPDLQGRGRR